MAHIIERRPTGEAVSVSQLTSTRFGGGCLVRWSDQIILDKGNGHEHEQESE